MVSLSIIGITGWVNPLRVAVRRPWTLSVARRRSAGAFFCVAPLGALLSGDSVGVGEAHGGATPRGTLQDGTRAIHRTARAGRGRGGGAGSNGAWSGEGCNVALLLSEKSGLLRL
jgi:hypothetical protein